MNEKKVQLSRDELERWAYLLKGAGWLLDNDASLPCAERSTALVSQIGRTIVSMSRLIGSYAGVDINSPASYDDASALLEKMIHDN